MQFARCRFNVNKCMLALKFLIAAKSKVEKTDIITNLVINNKICKCTGCCVFEALISGKMK